MKLVLIPMATLLGLCAPLGAQEEQREPGASLRLYDASVNMSVVPAIAQGQTPNVSKVVETIYLSDSDDDGGNVFGFEDEFVVEIEGYLNAPNGKAGTYTFRIECDDGGILYVRGEEAINLDGLHGRTGANVDIELGAEEVPFAIRYFENAGDAHLSFWWRPSADAEFELVPAGVMTCRKCEVRVTSPGEKRVIMPSLPGIPGDRQPLDGVHPSYDLATVRPSMFKPRVGGIDFLSDGRMVVCTWDPEGGVYILDGVDGDDPEAIEVSRFAAGLAEPLGLKVVDDRIFVLQKQELTELIDSNGDGYADDYRCVSNGWPVSDNFHEFAFGLVYQDGFFYCNLAVAIDPGGGSTQPQVPLRGHVLKIDAETGEYEAIAHGLRTPNGIGVGVDGEIFLTDNQGDWLPVSKLLHLREGAFYGSRAVMGDEAERLQVQRPVVWLPQGEIGNSPSEPAMMKDGPYAGQMLHGEVTHGGVKRVFVEKIGGDYQGCVFRFTQGLEAGINRIGWGPDGSLYVGGIGSTGNWGQTGKKRYGLQRLTYNGNETFEMLAVRAKSNGVEVQLTMPLAEGLGWDPSEYDVQQWAYVPTADYGGPKLMRERLEVASASVSGDRTRVFLELPGMKADRVVYVRMAGDFYTDGNDGLWSTEAWYTMNRVPAASASATGRVVADPPVRAHNTLSAREKAEGWELLFDGESMAHWRGFKNDEVHDGWAIEGGCITRVGGGGDIITREKFGNFELMLEWSVQPRGNSGIFYGVQEGRYNHVWETGPEMQVLDNSLHADGRNPMTSAGANYALHAPSSDVTRPVGAFNRVRLVVNDGHVEHWLNGVKLVEYEWGSDEWKRLVAASKFASMRDYGKFRPHETPGHIALQDHGDVVKYRNIKIRRLD